MHTCMRLQTCTHAHIHETVLRKRFQFSGKLYYTHKALHKIRQHSQMGKSKRGLSFSRGEWRKQTATDSLCQFISINVKLAGVGAGIPHLHHQLSIKTLSSLVHKLLLSEKKKSFKRKPHWRLDPERRKPLLGCDSLSLEWKICSTILSHSMATCWHLFSVQQMSRFLLCVISNDS